MPAAPRRPCPVGGCPNLLKPGESCPNPKHNARKQQDARRGSSRDRGYGTRWDKYSRWFRQQVHCPECGRNHVLCERCQKIGRYEPSEMVDHIAPVQSADDPRMWEHSNHQGLSRACHAIKTAEDIAAGLTR